MGTVNTRNIHSDHNVKSIVRTDVLNKLDIHCSRISDGATIFEPSKATEKGLARAEIHCNHYAIQSWDWFKTVKMTRGSANIASNDNVRTAKYFRTYDWNDTQDQELSNVIASKQAGSRG